MASKDLLPDDRQADLGLRRRAEPNSMPIEVIRKRKSSGAAFTLACDSCGLEDKEIYGECGIDAGYFSRMKKGDAMLQGDLLQKFCDTVNNRIFPEWLAYQVGCTLVQIQSEAERLLEVEREKRLVAERENKLMKSLLVGRIPAEVA